MQPASRFFLLGAALLAGCTITHYMDNHEAETAIGDHFSKMYPVHSVKCEDKVELKVGAMFTCQLRFQGATDPLAVNAHVTEVVNKRGKFDFKLAASVFDPAKLQQEIASGLEAQTGTDAKVNCGPPRTPKTGDTCDVTTATGEKATILLTAGADGTLEKWAVKTD